MPQLNSLIKIISCIEEETKNNNNLLVAIIGKSASGKDTIAEILARTFNTSVDVTCATRAKREGEVNGKQHDFITNEVFNELKEQGSFAALHSYINEKGLLVQFGTLRPNFEHNKIHFVVVDEGGADQLKQDGMRNDYSVKTLKIIASYEKRKARMLARGGMSEELFDLRESVNSGIDTYESD